tara:strand:- start:3066 stop:3935 length:870 start_codon:yes stop_codon:yes gene_type:complete
MNQSLNERLSWIDEYHRGVRYGLEGKLILKESSPFQEIALYETERYGKALLLDGCWMTAEKNEKYYHESLIHPALSSSRKIDNILIIGGGDGGSARECLRYNEVKSIDLIEIDLKVIELSKKYLPKIGGNAWSDSRLNVIIKNGIEWVKNTKGNYYDVIIIDGADPIGPSKELYSDHFLEDCKRILKPEGILATQSESPESFRNIHINIIKVLRQIFDFADPLYGSVSIYPSGLWSWTFATMDQPKYLYPMKSRVEEISDNCQIWSERWQQGGFNSIPAFIERELANNE